MSQCVESNGSPAGSNKAYRLVTYKGGRVYAHRAAWMREHGDIPDNMVVRHLCNNPSCINISHLALGTQQDNIQDAIKSGRFCKGTDSPHSKLTPEDVANIKKALQNNYHGLQKKLAENTMFLNNALMI